MAGRDRAHRHRRAADDELRLAVLRRRLLPLRPGLHAGVRGPRALQRPDRASAALARRPRLQRQAGRRDRQRRHRRHPGPGDGRHRRTRDDAAALADLHHAGAVRRTPSPTRCAALLGAKRAYAITRRKNITQQRAIFRLCQALPADRRAGHPLPQRPAAAQGLSRRRALQPAYNPWDQRLCVVPDGDLFKAIRDGHASVVTDRIETFTERGIMLESGRELEADIIVTATGLNLQAFGGMAMTVDGAGGEPGRHGRVQGHDARAACRTSRSPSATPTRRGR